MGHARAAIDLVHGAHAQPPCASPWRTPVGCTMKLHAVFSVNRCAPLAGGPRNAGGAPRVEHLARGFAPGRQAGQQAWEDGAFRWLRSQEPPMFSFSRKIPTPAAPIAAAAPNTGCPPAAAVLGCLPFMARLHQRPLTPTPADGTPPNRTAPAHRRPRALKPEGERQGWMQRLKSGLRKTGSSIATVFHRHADQRRAVRGAGGCAADGRHPASRPRSTCCMT